MNSWPITVQMLTQLLIRARTMPSNEELIGLWQEINCEFSQESESTILSAFAAEILNRWGWPYKPISTTDSMPPINQSFLGYYSDTGWLMDYWREGYVPYRESLPSHWLSLNILPNPDN